MTTSIDAALAALRGARKQHGEQIEQASFSKVHAIQRAETLVASRGDALAALATMRTLRSTATPDLLAGAEEFESDTYRVTGGRVASTASAAARRLRNALTLLAEIDRDAAHIQAFDDLTPEDVKDWATDSLIGIWWDRLRGIVPKPRTVQEALESIPTSIRELNQLMAWSPPQPSAGHVIEPRPGLARPEHAISSSTIDA
jgi:hypothetical protein